MIKKKSQNLCENGRNYKVFWVYFMADYIGGLPIMIGRLIGRFFHRLIGRLIGIGRTLLIHVMKYEYPIILYKISITLPLHS